MGPVASQPQTWLLPPALDDSGHPDTHVHPSAAAIRKYIHARTGTGEVVGGGGVRKNPDQANMRPVSIRRPTERVIVLVPGTTLETQVAYLVYGIPGGLPTFVYNP